ncbi:DNA-binding domain-containing protein [Paracoccus sp. SCSIO 75233]|uniref:HvfC/BufC N-terminal domain-containing protein n=1 Tax=Paracoccus sp. SCSIO 75233 TaxID=3017782 RepID=UPI0022F06EBA|nr:DNA-binding domain-containing protein [Paracoccus sp. SCSIO 75233]WBU54142.1 DNA-binding domain-containing protein [Paracoccus sp. SCSIO 75233]
MSGFSEALLSPDLPPPPGLTLPQGGDAGRRFAVYRNNVTVALSDALAANFPVIASLVGERFMAATAGLFLVDHPPKSPVLAEWGEDFAAWLANYPPAESLPYLPDMARLEQLSREALHARDARPVDPQEIAALPPERLESWRPEPHPAARAMKTRWPLLHIRNHALGRKQVVQDSGEILLTRPALTLMLTAAPAGTADALARLVQGATLTEALQDAARPGEVLACLLGQGALVEEGA